MDMDEHGHKAEADGHAEKHTKKGVHTHPQFT